MCGSLNVYNNGHRVANKPVLGGCGPGVWRECDM